MVKVNPDWSLCMEGHTGQLKVIDFDWAGESGAVVYPRNRGDVEVQWPANIGDPITFEHDRTLARRWWSQLL